MTLLPGDLERHICWQILPPCCHDQRQTLTSLQFSTSTSAGAAGCSVNAIADVAPPKFLHVFCSKCTTEIGVFSTRIGSVTLFKWQVACNTTVPTLRAPSGP